jgi:hypothetical protein
VRAAHCDPHFTGEEKEAAEGKELTAGVAKGKRVQMNSLHSPGHVE